MILTRFWRNGDGGVAPFLALAAIPLMGFVAMAIDYSRASSVRTSFQAALDATALMLSKDANGLEPAQVAAKASGYFNALFQRPEAINVLIAHQLSAPEQGSFKLMMSGSGAVVPVFAKLLGKTQIGFSATTEVLWGMKKLNLALVLDNTGSMSSSGKMTNLKAAAHDLLATLKNAAKDPGDIKVAIVPFAVDVNVGTAHVDATWIDWTDWEEVNGTCSNTSYKKKSTCVTNNKVWTTANHSTWNGCVTDRDQNNDTMNTASVAGSPATLFRAHQASACPVAMMPLSHDWIALNDKIDTMTPSGNTNVTIGLAWGFQLLSPVAPFNAPEADPNLDKVIIILTDGQNTENRWSTSTSSIDARTQKACANIKAANMRVYTVRVIDGNASLLKNCASKTDMYYNVNEASQLSGVFSAIAQNLANLRISK